MNRIRTRSSMQRFLLAVRILALAPVVFLGCSGALPNSGYSALASSKYRLLAGSHPQSVSVSLTGSGNPLDGEEEDVQAIVREVLLGDHGLDSYLMRGNNERGQVLAIIRTENSVTAGDSLSIVQVAYARPVRVESHTEGPLMATVFVETIPRIHKGSLNRDLILADLKTGAELLLKALLRSYGVSLLPGTPESEWLNYDSHEQFDWME